MTNIPQQWVDRALYDLDTAKAMLDAGRYIYVLFCCQQAVERVLKAVIVRRTNDHPPRTHNLVRLAELAVVDLTKDQLRFFRELSNY